MRRVLLFAAFLLLLGLTTATAASFDVQAEDIASFTTDVSISVPDPPARPGSYFLRGEAGVLPGLLEDDPAGTDPVRTKEILPAGSTVQAQVADGYRHSWQTMPSETETLRLKGPAQLRIFQNGNTDRVTAALFDCAPNAETTGCTQLGGDRISTVDGGGYVERFVDFAPLDHDIVPGRVLRVQIINNIPLPAANQKWSVQWGYKTNRPSRLDVTIGTSP